MGLEVRGVSHAFGDRVALDAVAFTVSRGVLTGLLGPNGAGKTTLMRIMLGVLEPQEGEVLWQGRRVGPGDRGSWGYMPQERGLYPGMAAGDQVTYFGRLHGLSRRDATERAHQILEEFGVADRWAERSDRLSGGIQQRIQLAAALVHDPEVVVLDEPFAGLDPVAVSDLSDSLRRRTADGCTVVFSSHQLDLVQDLCEEVVMVDHGRTVLSGRVTELRASSRERQLRVTVEGAGREWVSAVPGVTVVSEEADELRVAIPPGAEPLDVLDAARGAGRVVDFGLDLPTLSQLFLAEVHHTDERVEAP
jgi:ABC-2 type transport system ATP-binding protein